MLPIYMARSLQLPASPGECIVPQANVRTAVGAQKCALERLSLDVPNLLVFENLIFVLTILFGHSCTIFVTVLLSRYSFSEKDILVAKLGRLFLVGHCRL